MKINLLCFGITREILGSFEKTIEFSGTTVSDLKMQLAQEFPKLNQLKSLRIAVNEAYSDDAVVLSEKDEVVLIPPVSGG